MHACLGAPTATLDSTAERLDDFKSYMEARLGKASHMIGDDRLKQWLVNNKKVLRFYCVWDNRQNMYGDRRPYVLNYYLEDDTVEILEVHDNNNGLDPYPQLLKRGLMPKVGEWIFLACEALCAKCIFTRAVFVFPTLYT